MAKLIDFADSTTSLYDTVLLYRYIYYIVIVLRMVVSVLTSISGSGGGNAISEASEGTCAGQVKSLYLLAVGCSA